tara:strand:+ start:2748 stop:3005 length:258 start_codon:yes stop_codon:yes gene_type:complete
MPEEYLTLFDKPSPRHGAQVDWTMAYLRKYGHITPLEALHKFGIFRLAAIVHILRNDGVGIRTEMVYEDGKRFARYWFDDARLGT